MNAVNIRSIYVSLCFQFCMAIILELKSKKDFNVEQIFHGVFFGKINCMTKMDIKSQGVNVHI